MSGLRLSVEIGPMDLRAAIIDAPRDEAMDAILAIDLAIADAGFTESLIKKLAQSLRGDMDDADWLVLAGDIADMKP